MGSNELNDKMYILPFLKNLILIYICKLKSLKPTFKRGFCCTITICTFVDWTGRDF